MQNTKNCECFGSSGQYTDGDYDFHHVRGYYCVYIIISDTAFHYRRFKWSRLVVCLFSHSVMIHKMHKVQIKVVPILHFARMSQQVDPSVESGGCDEKRKIEVKREIETDVEKWKLFSNIIYLTGLKIFKYDGCTSNINIEEDIMGCNRFEQIKSQLEKVLTVKN